MTSPEFEIEQLKLELLDRKLEVEGLEAENNRLKSRLAKITACLNGVNWQIQKTFGEMEREGPL